MVSGIVFGVLIALLISSLLCEKIGRRYHIAIGMSVVIFGSVLQTVAVNNALFIVGRFLLSFRGAQVAVAAP